MFYSVFNGTLEEKGYFYGRESSFRTGCGGIIAGDLTVYIGMIYYYLLKADWALERFSGAVQQVGAEQAKLNLTTKFAQESTTVGMLVFTVFFITLWLGLRKNAEDRRG